MLLIVSCASNEGYTTGRERFNLTEAQKVLYETQAAHGDREAAQRMLEYHSFITGDQKGIKRWQKRVKELDRKKKKYAG